MAILVAAGLFARPAVAAGSAGYEVYVVLTPVPAAELQRMRGGLKIAGLDLKFAADVQVYVNNVMVAQTHLVLNDLGGMDSTTEFPSPAPTGFSVSPFLQDGPAGLNKMQGFTITDAAGSKSFALHFFGLDQSKTAVVNTINGLSVKQMAMATLQINNFAAVQSKLLRQALTAAAAKAGARDAVLGFGN